MKYKVKRTGLIDADLLAYSMAAWAQDNQGDVSDMAYRIESTLSDWIDRACCTTAFACFSCSREDNFRRDHYPLYKSNRSDEYPALLDVAKKIVSDNCQRTVLIPRLEADDVMGIMLTNGKVLNPVCITSDKDLRSVPGWHFSPGKQDFPSEVSVESADRLFYQQWLTGDRVDGFNGIKGVGPKTADKILSEGLSRAQMECDILAAYQGEGYTREEALAQARCARILRAEDFDVAARVAIPWDTENPALQDPIT